MPHLLRPPNSSTSLRLHFSVSVVGNRWLRRVNEDEGTSRIMNQPKIFRERKNKITKIPECILSATKTQWTYMVIKELNTFYSIFKNKHSLLLVFGRSPSKDKSHKIIFKLFLKTSKAQTGSSDSWWLNGKEAHETPRDPQWPGAFPP